jgi:hypothetical protein
LKTNKKIVHLLADSTNGISTTPGERPGRLARGFSVSTKESCAWFRAKVGQFTTVLPSSQWIIRGSDGGLMVRVIDQNMQKFQWFIGFLRIELFSLPYFYRQIFVLETYH